MTKTTDVLDAHPNEARALEVQFRSFGAKTRFEGTAATLKIHEDNALVRTQLEQPGQGRVLVVDGGGSMRRALVGDQLGALAVRNRWAGIVVYGCIRDSAELAKLDLGVVALGVHPRKSDKRGLGVVGEPLHIGSVRIAHSDYLWVDEDGVVVASSKLDIL